MDLFGLVKYLKTLAILGGIVLVILLYGVWFK